MPVPPAYRQIPNALTILRFALVPIFIVLIADAGGGHDWAAGVLFGVAAVTDQIDGWLARRWHVESEFGKYADPHNVTPQEISIDEKYDVKFKQAQAELQSLYNRQGTIQRKFSENPLAYQFTTVQTNRIQNTSCRLQQYPSYTPGDDNDP